MLDAMSPLKVLSRGYSVSMSDSGSVITSVQQVNQNDSVSVSVSDGVFRAVVLDKKEQKS